MRRVSGAAAASVVARRDAFRASFGRKSGRILLREEALSSRRMKAGANREG
jgi:hypothetical protein